MLFLQDPIKQAVERQVSNYRGVKWSIKDFRDMNDFSSHPSAILSDGLFSVFVKFSAAAHGVEQFEVELESLRLLSERAGVLTPTPIGTVPVEGGIIMILEGVPAMDRTSRQWRDIGRALAQIHRIKGTRFGWKTHNYFGPLYQDNRPMADWISFYVERRIYPRFMGAINSGHLSPDVIRQVEKLITRLPALGGPQVAPTLLHGDAQQNNFISTAAGAVVIDPAIYYGNPEIDLAYIDYFQPVPQDVFHGYREELPIDPGFHERRELWRLYGYLAAVEVEGRSYLPKLVSAVQRYL